MRLNEDGQGFPVSCGRRQSDTGARAGVRAGAVNRRRSRRAGEEARTRVGAGRGGRAVAVNRARTTRSADAGAGVGAGGGEPAAAAQGRGRSWDERRSGERRTVAVSRAGRCAVPWGFLEYLEHLESNPPIMQITAKRERRDLSNTSRRILENTHRQGSLESDPDEVAANRREVALFKIARFASPLGRRVENHRASVCVTSETEKERTT